ncbi:MAG: hypothetical protein AAF958_05335 [Planctomycetota bacterium]
MQLVSHLTLDLADDSAMGHLTDGVARCPVPGRSLEAQWQRTDGTVLVVTGEDRPYEETLHWLWVDLGSSTVLDRIDFGPPYQSMMVTQATVVDEQTVAVQVTDQDRLQVSLTDAAASTVRKWSAMASKKQFGINGHLMLTVLSQSKP